jgi:hypothetical protein
MLGFGCIFLDKVVHSTLFLCATTLLGQAQIRRGDMG